MAVGPQEGAGEVPPSPAKLPKSAKGSLTLASKLGVLELRGMPGWTVRVTGDVCFNKESQFPISGSLGLAQLAVEKLPKLADDVMLPGNDALPPPVARISKGSRLKKGFAGSAVGGTGALKDVPAVAGFNKSCSRSPFFCGAVRFSRLRPLACGAERFSRSSSF